jgi:hypothetical protein
MLYNPDIILLDEGPDATLKKLQELKPEINWQLGYASHDLGGYYYIGVDDEDEDFDDRLINEIAGYFNERDFDAIEFCS